MKTLKITILLTLFLIIFAGTPQNDFPEEFKEARVFAQEINKNFFNIRPVMWGPKINGTLNKLNTDKKILALTLDACGGKNGSGADVNLINFLIENNIKTTIFVNVRWIINNRKLFDEIAANPLFKIENHGLEHRPLTVSSREIYGISGTGSPTKAAMEVVTAGLIIKKLTGKKPTFFRSGTAYYDEASIKIAGAAGYKIAGFSIAADEGATLTAEQVKTKILKAKPGDIILAHINQPLSGTREGIEKAIPELIKEGYEFVFLSEAELIH